jgi:hypothetical protein
VLVTRSDNGSTQRLTLGVTNGSAFVGIGSGTDAAKGVQLSNVNVGLIAERAPSDSEARYAVQASGAASLQGVTGLTLAGTAAIEVNTLNAAVNTTIETPTSTTTLAFANGDLVKRVGGTLDLGTPLTTLTGAFAMEIAGTAPSRELLVRATNVSAFIGDTRGAGAADDVGISLRDGQLSAYVSPTGLYAFDASAVAGLAGVDGVTLSGTLNVQRNATGAAINRSVTVGGVTQTIALAQDVSRIGGSVELAIRDTVSLAGSIEVEKTSGTLTLSNNATVATDMIKIGGSGLSGFIGANGPASNPAAAGFSLSGVEFGLLVASPEDSASGADLRTWVAARATASSATIHGDAVTGSATNVAIAFNTADGTLGGTAATIAAKLSTSPVNVTTGDGSPVTLDFADETYQITATVALKIAEYATLSGAVGITQSIQTLALSDGTTVEAEVLAIGGQGLSGFAGVNAGASNAAGVSLGNVEVAFAMASDRLDINRRWTSLDATAGSATLTGINGVTLTAANLGLVVNDGDNNRVVVDYSDSPLAIAVGGTTRNLDLDGSLGESTFVTGTMTLGVADFFHATGTATFRKSLGNVMLANGEAKSVELLSLSLANASGFAGVRNGAVDRGLTLTGVNASYAFAADASDGDRYWNALQASASTVTATGLDGVTLSASDLAVEINRPDSTGQVIDWASLPLSVSSDPAAPSLDMDGQLGSLVQASGTFAIGVNGFFQVGGSLALRRSSGSVTLADASNTTTAVDLLTIGGQGLSAFAGVNGGTANAVGMALSGVDFALALASSQADPTRKWTALSASAASSSFSGVPGVSLSGSNLGVSINRPDKNGVLIDFAAAPLTVRTGPSTTRSLDLTGQSGPLLEVSGALALDVSGFFTASGTFALRKSTGTITLDDASTKNVDLLTIGAANITAFAGSNGASSERTGLSLGGVEFALAIASDQASPSNVWTTLQASA